MLDSGFNKAWGEEHPSFEKPIQSENQTIEVQLAKYGAKSKDIDIASNLIFISTLAPGTGSSPKKTWSIESRWASTPIPST